ncbi:ASCH domain-containing protein [Candidatus Daviesbacteria bacterium]|nr:ASCH domain-containing protein [Candidatus Daviesbacteria bacterium]
MTKHLAIFKGDTAKLILSGQKTIESRFSKSKIPPFGVVAANDLVYIKPSGKDIIGQFKVKKVIFYDGLTKDDLEDIKERYGERIAIEEKFFEDRGDCKYGTLIFVGDSARFIASPVSFNKKDQRGWVVLNDRLF